MPRPLLSVCFPCHPHSSWVSCVALTALVVQVRNCSHCRLVYFLSDFFCCCCLSFVSNPLFLYPWLVELKSATFPMSFLQKRCKKNAFRLLVLTAMWQRSCYIQSDWPETKTKLCQHWSGFPSPSLLALLPLLSLLRSLVRVLYPFCLSFLLLLFLLLNRLCLGMLATFELHSSMHFYLKSLFGLFIPLYCWVLLSPLFLHDVCENDSCIYQWNRVKSQRGFVQLIYPWSQKSD